MRQIDYIVVNYETDHNDVCIPYILGYGGSNKMWCRLLTIGDYWNGYYDTNRLYPKNVICPAESGVRSEGGVTYIAPHTSYTSTWDYGMNNIPGGAHPMYIVNVDGTTVGTIAKKNRISQPSALMNLMDLRAAAETDFNYSSFLTKAPTRHGVLGEGNVTFMDGHLATMTRIPFQRFAGEGIWIPSNTQYSYWYR